MQMRELVVFLAAMTFMAACGYWSAVAVFESGLWLFGDTDWVRAIVGPVAVFAGMAGMMVVPAAILFPARWVFCKIFTTKERN